MFLRLGAVGGFHNDIRLVKSRRHITLLNTVGMKDVRLQVTLPVGVARKRIGVERRRTRLHSDQRISHKRQRFILQRNELGGSFGLPLGLSYDQGNLVRFPAHPFCHFGAAGATKHRLIIHHQPILIDGNIFGREDGDHTGGSQGSADINRP